MEVHQNEIHLIFEQVCVRRWKRKGKETLSNWIFVIIMKIANENWKAIGEGTNRFGIMNAKLYAFGCMKKMGNKIFGGKKRITWTGIRKKLSTSQRCSNEIILQLSIRSEIFDQFRDAKIEMYRKYHSKWTETTVTLSTPKSIEQLRQNAKTNLGTIWL